MDVNQDIEVTEGPWSFKIGASFKDGEWSHIYLQCFKGMKYMGHTYDGEWIFNMLIPEYDLWIKKNSIPRDKRVLALMDRLGLKEDRKAAEAFYVMLEQAGRSNIFSSMIEDLMAFRPSSLCPNLDKNFKCSKMCLTKCVDGNKFWK